MKLYIETKNADALLEKFKQEINSLTEFHKLLNRTTQHGKEYESRRRWKYDNEGYFYLLDMADEGKDLKLFAESKSDGLEFYFVNEIDAKNTEMKTFFQDLICLLLSQEMDVESFRVMLNEK